MSRLEPRPGEELLALRINGQELEAPARPHHNLVRVLRRLGYRSVRGPCGIGMCGSCSVLVDGRLVSGCLTLAHQARGREILTVEGLVSDGQLHPIQQAFIDRAGFQCAYCTPGFILATYSLLREHPEPDRPTIREYLAGNLCRCGSYFTIEEAVLEAAQRLRTKEG